MHNTISVYATSFINRKTRTVMCAGDDVAGGGIDAGPVLCPYVDNHGRQGCTAWLGEQECMCRVSSLESKASSLWNLSLNLAKHFFSCWVWDAHRVGCCTHPPVILLITFLRWADSLSVFCSQACCDIFLPGRSTDCILWPRN